MSVDSKYRPHLEAQLEGGEELRGVCVASQQKGMLKTRRSGGLGVTDRQGCWFQSLNRRGDPDPIPADADLTRAGVPREGGFPSRG